MNRHRNRAFAVETLLLTLFFLLALALLVQLFGAAQAMGRQARQETDAALLLQNTSAQLHAGADPWAQAMADAVAGGQDVFALYIEEGLDFADTVEKLFQGGSYFLGDCVQRANTALDGEEQIDYAAIRYVPCESQRGVSVRLR